jgi:hypothetical protein
MTSPLWGETESGLGSLDGNSAGDHDLAFHFGRRPSVATPYPFSTRQYARLLVLRSRFEDRLVPGDDDTSAGGSPSTTQQRELPTALRGFR